MAMERARAFFWNKLAPVMEKLDENEVKKLFAKEKDFTLLRIVNNINPPSLAVLYEVDGAKWAAVTNVKNEDIALFRVD